MGGYRHSGFPLIYNEKPIICLYVLQSTGSGKPDEVTGKAPPPCQIEFRAKREQVEKGI